jgi:ubiquinone/menaquinone biosynthesis C-methylase UbiE
MAENTKNTKEKQRRSATMEELQKTYLPGMRHDWLLPLYDPLQKLLGFESVHRQLVDQADIHPNHRVIEIGCGTGNLSILIKRLHPQAEVVGLDPDPKALSRARRKAEREAISVQLDRGFAEELPYPDASFDRVFSALMFHHLGSDEKEKTLLEALRVLKPGGSLHLLDFGGAKVRSEGFIARLHSFIARLQHRSERLRDNFGERIPTLMREAGFADPTEVAHRLTIFGPLTYYRATVLRAESGTA